MSQIASTKRSTRNTSNINVIEEKSLKSASLYVHIPFCASKCAYCDFFSVPIADKKCKIDDDYIKALSFELLERKNAFKIDVWRTVYIGGGTPSLLSTKQIQELICAIKNSANIANGAEITIECNPSDITKEFLCALKNFGINRLSLGLQSFCDKSLQMVFRRSSSQKNKDALFCIQKHFLNDKNNSLSVDLICGLPFQTKQSLLDDIKFVMPFSNHISLYTLMLEENTPLFNAVQNGTVTLQDCDAVDDAWLCARDLLEKNGFLQYEVSNFAKNGKMSAHNLCYWQSKDYVGIGSGATGTVGTMRYTNATNIALWQKNALLTCLKEELDKKTRQFEYVMMGMRLRDGINKEDFEKRFGQNLDEYLAPVWQKWQAKGFAKVCQKNQECQEYQECQKDKKTLKNQNTTFYQLTKDGICFLNQFLKELASVHL